ncbi:MAG: glycosyltransferase family 4 protein [Pseudomonadota bacterium]
MQNRTRIVHVLDDTAMGGVTRALENFQHPALVAFGAQETRDMRHSTVRATSRRDIAVIHFTANWQKLAWLLDLRLRGGFSKLILIEHTYTAGFEAHEVTPKRRFRRMLKLAYRLVDTVVAVSQAQRAWMLDHKLASADKIVAIPQSRDCQSLQKLAPARRAPGPLRLGAFGRFHKQKGFDLLIEAMARIPADRAVLKLAGTGPDEARLRQRAAKLPHVEICAAFSSPEAFLADTDMIAIPSRWEAFGLVGTEARAAGRPILAAWIDGLQDQLDETGVAHAPNDVESLVCAILQAAAAKDIEPRGAAARTRAAGEYDQMIQRWQALFQASLGSSESGSRRSATLRLG